MPTRPARCVSGFWTRQVPVSVVPLLSLVELKSQTHHGQVRLGRYKAGRQGGAGLRKEKAAVRTTREIFFFLHFESKALTYHRRFKSRRPAGQPCGVEYIWMPTKLFAEKKVHCIFTIPRHALHDTKRRRSTGRLPGRKNASRPADTSLMNQWLTADFVPPSVYIGFFLPSVYNRPPSVTSCSCFLKVIEAMFPRCLGGYGGLLCPGRIVLLAPNLARPRTAAPPGAPSRPARGMSGFWIGQVRRRVTGSLSPQRHGKTRRRNVSREHTNKSNIFITIGGTKRGLGHRFISMTTSALPSCLPTSEQRYFL